MGETFKAYTEEQEKELKEISESGRYGNISGDTGAQESTLREILKTLQRIEKALMPENQGECIRKAVTSAFVKK